ncbi:peptidoglycan bridge formation glycyltransferase FemA/FemB family protein [bacterium]|nr:peptidoglycan bridge formation glycyltransferase FemA/FemB family protein [bacterium]
MLKIDFVSKQESENWDDFLVSNNGSFLQSFEWGEFQASQNKKVWRLGVSENNLTLAEAQIIEEKFPFWFKNCLYIPFGPAFKNNLSLDQRKEILGLILKEIRKIAQNEKSLFLKIEPKFNLSFLKNYPHCFFSQKRMQPAKTLVLDLSEPVEKIFRNFNPTLRYDIRRSLREGVKVSFQNKYHSDFYRLIQKTAQRGKFRPFKEEYYKSLFNFPSKDFKVKMSLARFKGKIIAGYIIVFFAEEAVCLHGGSDRSYKKLQAPSLLQWEQIKLAKKEGYKIYDFWGIDRKKMKGVTFFKKSFNGKIINYSPSVDFAYRPFCYQAYRVLRRIKKCF